MIIYKPINIYIQDKLAKCSTGFRKPHDTQYSLLAMLERGKRGIGKEEYVSTLYMVLSKPFDTIN